MARLTGLTPSACYRAQRERVDDELPVGNWPWALSPPPRTTDLTSHRDRDAGCEATPNRAATAECPT